eukprot:5412257-Amphidinium_carterae.1
MVRLRRDEQHKCDLGGASRLEKPSLTICAKGASVTSLLDGDAPTAMDRKPRARQAEPLESGTAPKRQRQSVQQPGPKVHKTNEKGEYTHNRKGIALCAEFQVGQCKSIKHGAAMICGKDETK